MEPPVITRQRRPFLAPIWVAALIAAIVLGILFAGYRSLTTTTLIVTRHAEKVLGTIEDAPLTPEGENRAQNLARVLGVGSGPGRIDAIYIMNIRSALQTAVPLASRLNIQPTMIRESDLRGLASRLLRAHRGKTVLLIVTADAVNDIVRSLSPERVKPLGENDYGSAFAISIPSIGDSNLFEIRY